MEEILTKNPSQSGVSAEMLAGEKTPVDDEDNQAEIRLLPRLESVPG
jgi:hypothetical protein